MGRDGRYKGNTTRLGFYGEQRRNTIDRYLVLGRWCNCSCILWRIRVFNPSIVSSTRACLVVCFLVWENSWMKTLRNVFAYWQCLNHCTVPCNYKTNNKYIYHQLMIDRRHQVKTDEPESLCTKKKRAGQVINNRVNSPGWNLSETPLVQAILKKKNPKYVSKYWISTQCRHQKKKQKMMFCGKNFPKPWPWPSLCKIIRQDKNGTEEKTENQRTPYENDWCVQMRERWLGTDTSACTFVFPWFFLVNL